MPIRPENRERYPADWPAISLHVRTERAGGRCECHGQCGADWPATRHAGPAGRCTARQGQPHPVTGSRVLLTVAHLDRTPEHCELANLAAMCQRCHLSYDSAQHAANAARTRAARLVCAGQLALFGPEVSS